MVLANNIRKVSEIERDGLIGYNPNPISSISSSRNGNYVTTWGNASDIFAQQFLNNGEKLNSNFRINDDKGKAPHSSSVALDDSGNFIITWFDYRNTTGRL